MNTLRIPCLVSPRYDIDALLNQDLTAPNVAFEVTDAVYQAIESDLHGGSYRPDSALLTPEVVVRDLRNFDMSMGSGLAACFANGGLQCFFRALRALRIIQHRKGLALAEAVREVLQASGAREPSRFPDDPLYGDCDVDWDRELEDVPDFDARVEEGTRHLDDGWFEISHNYWIEHQRFTPEDPPLHYTICAYLDANRAPLRSRKEPHAP
jgi:hypothetical protein